MGDYLIDTARVLSDDEAGGHGGRWGVLGDPATLLERRRVRVTADGEPVTQLNELEWVDGEVFANVWQTDRIARIDPASGRVVGWIDLAGILPARERIANYTDVLNGIAYDAATKRLFVTGKFWPKVFEIRLLKKPAAAH